MLKMCLTYVMTKAESLFGLVKNGWLINLLIFDPLYKNYFRLPKKREQI